MYRISPQLSEKIKHFATFPQTGVSLRQMVMFGKGQLMLLIPSHRKAPTYSFEPVLTRVAFVFVTSAFRSEPYSRNPLQGQSVPL